MGLLPAGRGFLRGAGYPGCRVCLAGLSFREGNGALPDGEIEHFHTLESNGEFLSHRGGLLGWSLGMALRCASDSPPRFAMREGGWG